MAARKFIILDTSTGLLKQALSVQNYEDAAADDYVVGDDQIPDGELVALTSGNPVANKFSSTTYISESLLPPATILGGSGKNDMYIKTNGDGKIDATLLPLETGLNTVTVPTSVDLVAGDFVSFLLDAGTVKVRKASNSGHSTIADGYVREDGTTGSTVTVYLTGVNDCWATPKDFVVGASYYLGTTGDPILPGPGSFPSSPGNVIQFLGRAVGSNALAFEEDRPIVLA